MGLLPRLVDIEARESPTFTILPRAERVALMPGVLVKVIILYARPLANGCDGERVWCRIGQTIAPDCWRATLVSNPCDPSALGVSAGDRFLVGPEHVLDIHRPESTR